MTHASSPWHRDSEPETKSALSRSPRGTGPRGASTSQRRFPLSSQPKRFNPVSLPSDIPLGELLPSSSPGTFACISTEPARIRMRPLYLLSSLSNPNIQPLHATPCAGSCGQHRDESDTFLAHKELSLGGEGGGIPIDEAPTVNRELTGPWFHL